LVSSPVLWGGLMTVLVYLALPHLPVHREMAVRYLAGHWIEYVTTALFCVGLATLLLKFSALVGENAAARCELKALREAIGTPSARLERAVEQLPRRFRSTHFGRRLIDTRDYLRARTAGGGLEEHLKYLADLAAGRVHESYGLIRTVCWAVPILGFLGTVMGITIAIANVTPEQLDTSLSAVTGGLAVAFDTTAQSLAMSLVLVIGNFAVERSEQRVLGRVEDFATRQLAVLAPAAGVSPEGTLAHAQTAAAERLIEETDALVSNQTRLWQEAMESLRRRWTETLREQQEQLTASLAAGTGATLAEHETQLRAARGELVNACRQVAADLQAAVHDLRDSQAELMTTQFRQQESLWQRATEMVAELRGDMAGQVEELGRQKEVLLQVVSQEADLARLQNRLNENLHALRGAEALEETLHSLSAAVHLLTARAKPRDAHDNHRRAA
jgi:biopolymer transport protein ExbB/TolQ